MDSQHAKEILRLYRPGTADAHDPQFAEALAQAHRDPELARWFEQHCALYVAIQGKFKQITVPADLKEQILAGLSSRGAAGWRRRRIVLAAAAAFVFFIGLAVLWLTPRSANNYSAYRDRMVRTALRPYSLSMVTNDLNQIRRFLSDNQAHGDFVASKALEQLPGDGCALLSWQGQRVSLVCFDLGNHNDLFLFVVHRSAVRGAPPSASPQFVKVKKLMTASWTAGDKTYLLAGPGDEQFLRKFL